MKIDRRRGAFVAFSLLSLVAANATPNSNLASEPEPRLAHVSSPRLEKRDVSDGTIPVTGGAESFKKAIPAVGTEHAPVDGKDGIPRSGPWVETNAERERKKEQVVGTTTPTTKKTTTSDDDDDDALISNIEEDADDDDGIVKTKLKSKPKPNAKVDEAQATPTSLKTLREGLKDKDTEIPQSNGGVMDDKSRAGPVEGTRGVEGGISEKNKDILINNKGTGNYNSNSKDEKPAKIPETPKEQPPLPHSEKEKIKGAIDAFDSKDETPPTEQNTPKKLEKPADLPDKPYSHSPVDNAGHKDDTIIPGDGLAGNRFSSSSGTNTKLENIEHEDIIQPLHSLFLSFTMILFSEIGDKTFLVACLMAMRHDRLLVFSAAFSALITMTVLSAVLGHAVPTLIPKWLTNFLAAGLFLVFGVKMLIEARGISPDEGVSEEMKEVEQELEEKEHEALRSSRRRSSVSPYMLESGRANKLSGASGGRLPSPPDSPASSRSNSPSGRGSGVGGMLRNMTSGMNNLFSLLLSPAWVQTFVMTFLGEWGDRSQIATIAMAAGQDYWWVVGGALGGHAICTGVAVIGGKAIAGKVSLRTVTMGGAFAFLVFGVVYLLEAVY